MRCQVSKTNTICFDFQLINAGRQAIIPKIEADPAAMFNAITVIACLPWAPDSIITRFSKNYAKK